MRAGGQAARLQLRPPGPIRDQQTACQPLAQAAHAATRLRAGLSLPISHRRSKMRWMQPGRVRIEMYPSLTSRMPLGSRRDAGFGSRTNLYHDCNAT